MGTAVLVVVVAAIEGEGVVEATLLGLDDLLVVVAATEGGGGRRLWCAGGGGTCAGAVGSTEREHG